MLKNTLNFKLQMFNFMLMYLFELDLKKVIITIYEIIIKISF